MQALDVERVSDDPPERVEAWLSTVSDVAVRDLDLNLLLDLLKLEPDPVMWRDMSRVVTSEIGRRTLLGQVQDAQQLVEALTREIGDGAREALRTSAESALDTLASMLDDADPQVQRESIRAIVQIGTNASYAVLEKALVARSATRDTIVQQLIGLRDDKAVPLLCYVLNRSAPRGKLVEVHAQII